MSDPTTQATTTETPAEASPAAPDPSKAATPEERASLLKAALRAQPADVPTGDGETAEAQAAPVAEAAPVDAVAERRARLDALRQKERERAELRKKRAPDWRAKPTDWCHCLGLMCSGNMKASPRYWFIHRVGGLGGRQAHRAL